MRFQDKLLKERRDSRWFLLICSSSVFLCLLSFSFYFIYNAPSLGITTAWDDHDQCWKVASARPWSALKSGDAIKKIDDIEIAFHHLLLDNVRIGSREELFRWLETKRKVFEKMTNPSLSLVILREGKELTVPVIPRKAALSFFHRIEFLRILEGIVFFLIGLVILYKKGSGEQSLVFLLMCMTMAYIFVSNGTSLVNEIVYQPSYLYLINMINLFSFFLASPLALYFTLLIPRKRRWLAAFPSLTILFFSANILLAAMCQVQINNVLIALYYLLAVVSVIHGFFVHKESIERQQMKWVMIGFVFGIAPWVIVNGIPILLTGKGLMPDTIPGLFVVCVPLFIAFAIQKYRIMDIDSFLEGSFVYLVTLGLLTIVDFSFINFISSSFAHYLDMGTRSEIVFSLFLVVSLYAPIREKARIFFRRMYNRDVHDETEVLENFRNDAMGKQPRTVIESLVQSIRRTFQPQKLLLIEGEGEEAPFSLASLRGKTDPVLLWEQDGSCIDDQEGFYIALPFQKEKAVQFGVFVGQPMRGSFFSKKNLNILKNLYHQADILYKNALLHEENNRQKQERLMEEKKHILEKEKIIKDLHDGIGGIATNISLLAEGAKQYHSLEDTRKILDTISELSRDSLLEIRSFMQSLDMGELNWETLAAELRHFGSRMLGGHGITLEFDINIEENVPGPESLLYLNLFRIYKEGITNIIKHSGADEVKIILNLHPEELFLSLSDNGRGLKMSTERGRGIRSMETRAKELGGSLEIVSAKGVCITLKVPLPIKYPSLAMD